MNRKHAFWIALWVVLVVITGYFAFFRAPWGMGYGPWHGWGWAERWNNESASYPAYRSWGWHGMAPGWVGGWGPDGEWEERRNHGMMSPYGGMPGMGFGMPGYGPMPGDLPGLTPEQSGQIAKLQAEHFEQNRALMQQIWQARAHINELYAADKRDWNAIRSTTKELHELQGRLQESAMNLQQKIDGLLAKQ